MAGVAVLDEEMWAWIEPLLPPLKGAMGRPMVDHRRLVEGAVYRYRTGIAWRDLPTVFGSWQTVWKRHRRFSVDGTWDRVLTVLHARADAADDIDWRVSVDTSVVRVHQHGSSVRRSSPPFSHTGGTGE